MSANVEHSECGGLGVYSFSCHFGHLLEMDVAGSILGMDQVNSDLDIGPRQQIGNG